MFYNFGFEHIPKEMRKVIGNKSIITKVCRMQAYNSIMRGYFCIGFIDFMLKEKVCQSTQIHFLLKNIKRMTK